MQFHNLIFLKNRPQDNGKEDEKFLAPRFNAPMASSECFQSRLELCGTATNNHNQSSPLIITLLDDIDWGQVGLNYETWGKHSLGLRKRGQRLWFYIFKKANEFLFWFSAIL